MGNNNPNQTPGQKAPGQDDQTRRDTDRNNPNDPNRQKTPGSGNDNPGQRTGQDNNR
jgi:hypothetical protein